METKVLYNENPGSAELESIGLRKNRKYAVSALAGGLIVSGGVFAWGMDGDIDFSGATFPNEPESTPSIDVPDQSEAIAEVANAATHNELSAFEKAFALSRKQDPPGSIFEYKGNYYSNYLKEEWDAFSVEEKKQFHEKAKYRIAEQQKENNVNPEVNNSSGTTLSLATNVDDSMELTTAVQLAREEGADCFQWKGELYPTYTQEEFAAYSFEQQAHLQDVSEKLHIHPPVSLADSEYIDLDPFTIEERNEIDSNIFDIEPEILTREDTVNINGNFVRAVTKTQDGIVTEVEILNDNGEADVTLRGEAADSFVENYRSLSYEFGTEPTDNEPPVNDFLVPDDYSDNDSDIDLDNNLDNELNLSGF